MCVEKRWLLHSITYIRSVTLFTGAVSLLTPAPDLPASVAILTPTLLQHGWPSAAKDVLKDAYGTCENEWACFQRLPSFLPEVSTAHALQCV